MSKFMEIAETAATALREEIEAQGISVKAGVGNAHLPPIAPDPRITEDLLNQVLEERQAVWESEDRLPQVTVQAELNALMGIGMSVGVAVTPLMLGLMQQGYPLIEVNKRVYANILSIGMAMARKLDAKETPPPNA